MPTHVALLRGINVGGHNRVAMADLRAVVASLGHADVATYIQSGNVVFTPGGGPTPGGTEPDVTTLAGDLERAIADRLEVRPRVVVFARDELADLVAANPVPDEPDPKRLHVVLHAEQLRPDQVAAVAAAEERARARGTRDRAHARGRVLYLHTPDGMSRSLLAEELTRPGPDDTVCTARNWATVTRLLAMLDGGGR